MTDISEMTFKKFFRKKFQAILKIFNKKKAQE
jgi:hypothetical protein